MNWLVIGSSPLAIEATKQAKAENQIDKTITCNRGILIDPVPSCYFLSDAKACRIFNAHARAAHLQGTTCITLRRSDHALKRRGVEWFPVVLDEAPPYEPFKLSGLWCQEIAAVYGATTVFLAGLDGWGGDQDYFDPELGKTTHVTNWSRDIIKPRCELLAAKYPNVAWVQYGRPRYTVEAPNWHVIEL